MTSRTLLLFILDGCAEQRYYAWFEFKNACASSIECIFDNTIGYMSSLGM